MMGRIRAVLDWLETQLTLKRDIAGCLFVSAIAFPIALQLFLMALAGRFHPAVQPLFDQSLLWLMLAESGASVLIYAITALYCWPRFRSDEPRPALSYALVTFLLVSATLTTILYGHLDTPFAVMLFAALALARAWFPTRVLMPGIVIGGLMFVAVDLLIATRHMRYAPLLTAPVMAGGQMAPFWRFSLQSIYTNNTLFFVALMLFLYAILERRRDELVKLTREDALTGLLNRATFLRVYAEECKKQQRTGRAACVLMCDIDHFKRVNDTHGHPAGDRVLVCVGALLQGVTRFPIDVPARFGGEEFVVLLPETGLDAAVRVAERIGEQLRAQVFESEGQRFSVTVSIGVAEIVDGDGTQALKLADDRLYQAKAAGRDRVVVHMLRGADTVKS